MGKILLAALFLVACAATTYASTYIGCYKDTTSRVLTGKFTKGSMTVEKCVQTCSIANQLFAGVGNGNQCFCGNTFKSIKKLTDSACDLKCTGNVKQRCGGRWKISVYSTNKYVGCYEDKQQRLLFGPMTKTMTKMTTNYCINYCKGEGSLFAATEHSEQCFCGNVLRDHAKKSDSECNNKCNGARSENCGGMWRASVYRV